MTQEKGVPYRRHKPSAAVRAFLDPLDPGLYFDCGNARLRGLDEALLREAERRGRAIGDDSFHLVATDTGLIYCRPSIAFAIAAKWDEVTMRMAGADGPVVLEVTWPVHGPLKFTVSRRLGGNVYRRWQQLRNGRSVGRSRPAVTSPGPAEPAAGQPLAQMDGAPVVVELGDLDTGSDTVIDLSANLEPSETDSTDEFDFTSQLAASNRGEAEPEPVVVESEPEPEPVAVEPEPVAVEPEPAAVEPEPEPVAIEPKVPARVRINLDWPEPDEVSPHPAAIRRQRPFERPVGVGASAGETSPAWVGSPMSFAATAAALSVLVLLATLTAAAVRRTGALVEVDDMLVLEDVTGVEDMAGAAMVAGPRTTIDHQRFRPGGRSDSTIFAATDAPAAGPSSTGTPMTTATTAITSTTDQVSPNGPSTVVTPGEAERQQAEPMAVVIPRLCDANYSGCVPVVVDVDCPGTGDGPVYLDDTAVVIMGQDVYGLDTDGDGMVCEADQPPLAVDGTVAVD